MTIASSPLAELAARLEAGQTTPGETARETLKHSNQNAGGNVYLALDTDWTFDEARRAEERFRRVRRPPLYGLPVSLKDCFDLEGFRTSAGTRFYSERNEPAPSDSAVAARLREEGAVITGKTHLHPLAYGITGENPDFGDCLQPADARLLTGGSTSGGAASVQEGSAVAAIGTDTGGSIRVPAALSGLAGYRASIDLAARQKLWTGAVPLAQSFDTLGWIFRDLRDGPLLAEGLFRLKTPARPDGPARVGAIAGSFLDDCDETVRQAFELAKRRIEEARPGSPTEVRTFEAQDWEDATSIYAPIQASEAAAFHGPRVGGDFSCFPAPIGERLAWGASLDSREVERQRSRHAEFRRLVDRLFERFDFLLLPCAPMSRLESGKDHSDTRKRILRYTVPASLAGNPVVALPFPGGAGMQLVGARGEDGKLLAFAAGL